jgi:hypothetical protein
LKAGQPPAANDYPRAGKIACGLFGVDKAALAADLGKFHFG